MQKTLLTTILILLSSFGFACDEFYQTSQSLSFYRQPLANNRCSLVVHPINAEDLIYRDYVFMQDGMIMVFNSYGEGPSATKTAARVFYLFPRGGQLDVAIENERALVQLATNKVKLGFDNQTGRLNFISSGIITEEKKVYPGNSGGVEIKISTGLMLDSGFAIGHDPRTNPNDSSIFTDRRGSTCLIINSDLFKYTDTGSISFKWSDPELKNLLQTRCPQLLVD